MNNWPDPYSGVVYVSVTHRLPVSGAVVELKVSRNTKCVCVGGKIILSALNINSFVMNEF